MASKPLRFHPQAEQEYLTALAWYRERSLIAAINFESAFGQAIARIKEAPQRWPIYFKIFWFGDELHALGLQFFKGLAAIGGVERAGTEHAFLQQCGNRLDVFRVILSSTAALHLDESPPLPTFIRMISSSDCPLGATVSQRKPLGSD